MQLFVYDILDIFNILNVPEILLIETGTNKERKCVLLLGAQYQSRQVDIGGVVVIVRN